jgi:hypothetical protein
LNSVGELGKWASAAIKPYSLHASPTDCVNAVDAFYTKNGYVSSPTTVLMEHHV